MNDTLEGFLALIVLLISGGFFFFPLIISIFTGNWWFMSLFSISWIAGLGVGILGSAFLDD